MDALHGQKIIINACNGALFKGNGDLSDGYR